MQWIWEFDIAAADLMLITTAVETELIDHVMSLLYSSLHVSLEMSSVDIRQIYRASEDVDWDTDNSKDCWREVRLNSININRVTAVSDYMFFSQPDLTWSWHNTIE